MEKRKKAYRFLPSSDIALLKETIKYTPWSATHGEMQAAWDKIANSLTSCLDNCVTDGKACRRRFFSLIDTFRRSELESLRASGTVEDYNEREQLLTDVVSMIDSYTDIKHEKTLKGKKDLELRDIASNIVISEAMNGMKCSTNTVSDAESAASLNSKRARLSNKDVICDYLRSKRAINEDRERERKQRFELEERKVVLEELRLALDHNRNNKLMELMSSQMQVLAKLIETVAKSKQE